jgi:hypothetical protein
LESADRAFGQRRADGGSDCGGRGQEPSDGVPLALLIEIRSIVLISPDSQVFVSIGTLAVC